MLHRAASLCLVLLVGTVSAQEILLPDADRGSVYVSHTDMAVFAAGEKRIDLGCSVEPLDPKLEYDLNFQVGYVASLPLSMLSGGGDTLRVLFRVQPLDVEAEPTYFHKRLIVPAIPDDAQGGVDLPGRFRVGPGRYRVSWLMRDRSERVCSDTWEIEAEEVDTLEPLAASPGINSVSEIREDIYYEEPPIRRSAGRLLHVKVLISFTPVLTSRVGLSEYDQRSIVSMLRAIARDPEIGSFSLVAYDAHSEQVFHQESKVTRIDFPALGEALLTNPGGTVDIEQLQDKQSGETFLRGLFEEHVARRDDEPDAIVFLGPKVTFERNPSASLLHSSDRPAAPIFYFVYNRNPRSYPWRDAISTGLRGFNAKEFDIITPKNFGAALKVMLDQLAARAESDD